MPELPEVETIVRGLNRTVIKKKITAVFSDWPKMIKQDSPRGAAGTVQRLKGKVKNAKFKRFWRRAKYVVGELDNSFSLVFHLRMTGHLLYRPQDKKRYSKALLDPYNKYIHFRLTFSNGYELAFSDLRKFGTVELVKTSELEKFFQKKKLGPEPLTKLFTYSILKRILKGQKRPIKQVLMDQSLIAGIGNIYADEILFEAGIKPNRRTNRVTEKERRKIFQAIKKVLTKAVQLRGTSVSDFRDVRGEKGNFQKVLVVYRQTGKKCPKCGSKVKRVKIGQRSAHYCPRCQT
jgi:formamidopyrimidine-DNA glycosylase